MEQGERLARAETRLDIHDQELERLRRAGEINAAAIASTTTVVAQLSEQIKHAIATSEATAERAAQKAIAAWAAAWKTENDPLPQSLLTGLLTYSVRVALWALVIAAGVIGIKHTWP